LSWPGFGATVPRPAPEFVIRQTDGQQKLLSQYKGKVVALEFLMTTCPHCQNCSSIMNKLYKEYGPKGFQPLGVAFNDMATLLVPDYVKQLDLDFPVGVATREEVLSFLEYPVVQRMYVPQLVFIDKKGVIRGQYGGGDAFFQNEEANMRQTIEQLLKDNGENSKPTSRPASKAKRQAKTASLHGGRELQ
jgi:peroxiredoxin